MENDKNYYVYMHINKKNNKIYIGITKNKPYKRWKNGKGYIGQAFYNAIEKYGWDNFEHIVFAENLTKENAELYEKRLISLYKTTESIYGYNVAKGGYVNSGYKFSEESKRKMSENKKGENNPFYKHKHTQQYLDNASKRIQGDRNPMYNKTHTEEVKKYISEINSGENNPRARRIYQLNKDTKEVIKEWAYAKLAAIYYDIDLSNLIKCCNGKKN